MVRSLSDVSRNKLARASPSPCLVLEKQIVTYCYLGTRTLTGCSEYADAFIGQEIDGQALMLLREEHMVVAMNMKLGPALKIISKVTQLKRASMKDP